MMRSFLRAAAVWLALISPAFSAGTLPIALQQSVDANGSPLSGCLLYIFQVGTTATPQNAFTDFGLTIPLPNPIPCDAKGRLPMFYLADGAVHVRLTDSGGLVQFDYPSMQVIGPSAGGGGGGSVDPASIASTGDIKFRVTGETLTGWVKPNGTTIGSATSGASQRAASDTQNLFIYLWNNCTDAHCPVVGGRGASGLADFSANKQITLPDMRSRAPRGLDDMGTTQANRLGINSVTSGGGDTVTTPLGSGGESNHVLTIGEMPSHLHTITDPGHAHSITDPGHIHGVNDPTHTHVVSDPTHAHTVSDPTHAHGVTDPGHAHSFTAVLGQALTAVNAGGTLFGAAAASSTTTNTATTNITINGAATGIAVNAAATGIALFGAATGISIQNHGINISAVNTASTGITQTTANGSGGFHNVLDPFVLGSFYMKL